MTEDQILKAVYESGIHQYIPDVLRTRYKDGESFKEVQSPSPYLVHFAETLLRNLQAASPENSRAVGLEFGLTVAGERAEKLLRERDQARKERDVAVRHIARWCVAVDERGGGWDEWDSFYKDAMWNGIELPEIRKHLTEAIAEARDAEEWA